MKFGRFFWKLFLGHVALLALVLTAALWLSLSELDRFHSEELTPYVRNLAVALRQVAEDELASAARPTLADVAGRLAVSQPGEMRVTLIAPDGRVLADSQSNTERMDSHADRPEVIQALARGEGQSTRFSNTIGVSMKYFAQRVGPEGAPLGVIRLAVPIRRMAERAAFVRTLLWPVGAIALAAAVLLAVGLAVLWSGRIRRLTRTAQNLARGDLSSRVEDEGADEVAMLARSLNRMRDRLSGQLRTIDHQRGILQTLLSRLQEGVIVARPDGRIVLLNQEASRLLNLPEISWAELARNPRMSVEECVPQHDLQQLLLGADHAAGGLASSAADDPRPQRLCEARFELPGSKGPLVVLGRASDLDLPDLAGAATDGAPDRLSAARLVVLTDITDLAKAAKMRSDFVANASHELRTPLAAIRGAVQTVLGMDPALERAAATRFLQMIERHSSRLEAMVADLLELSRLESPGKRFMPTDIHLQKICDELQSRWAEAAAAKELQWNCHLEPTCTKIRANAHLLQVVLDNLVENAIKFTDRGGAVTFSCRCSFGGVSITVADNGCGIAKADQERVFERFYQVDSARSAGEGAEKRGTGLGLSIVRHAMAAMGGSVTLESEPNQGTQVTITLPSSGFEASS